MVAKRKVYHKVWRKSKSAEDKHTLVYTAVLSAQESKLQEFTANLQSESGRKNCFRIARQMAREGRDGISVSCMKNIWRKYIEKLLNVENDCCCLPRPCLSSSQSRFPLSRWLNTRIDPTGFRHRSSGNKPVGCMVQANRCLTSCGKAPVCTDVAWFA